ncbi:MAG: HupE/UreJ family protein [Saprospiraceae bacterium]
MNTLIKTAILSLFCFILPFRVGAHAPDQSYVFLKIYADGVNGIFEITTKDLNKGLGLNLPSNLTVESLAPHLQRIQDYVLEKVAFNSVLGNHPIQFTAPEILNLDDLGEFVQLNFELGGMEVMPEALDITYEVLLKEIPNHQGLLVIAYNWKAGVFDNEAQVSLIFDSGDTVQELSLTESSVLKGFWAMIKQGMWHIWIGIDHILFLLALVLPAVVRRIWKEKEKRQGFSLKDINIHKVLSPAGLRAATKNWIPVESFKPALIYVLKVVTFFTIAHTITLSLAALGLVNLPSRFVESVIALSIALAAYHNISPLFGKKDWVIAFGFGLFHGFGFASVLGEIGLRGEFMTLSLLGFNLGVEIGQLAIICLMFPVLYLYRLSKNYPKVLIYGSVFLIVVSLYWFVERSFDVNFLLDDFAGRAFRKVLRIVGLL